MEEKETSKIIKTTPKDELVSESYIHPINPDSVGKMHKGYSTTKIYSTNDPRISRSFVGGMCLLFFIIGIILLLTNNIFFGIIFVIFSILAFFTSKRDIDKVAKELKKEGKDVTIDSVEEIRQIEKEVLTNIKNDGEKIAKETFTKNNYNWFIKYTIPIYCIIGVIISLTTFFLFGIFLGIFVFGIVVIIGIMYYFIFLLIFKY